MENTNGIAIGLSVAAIIVSILSPLFEYWWNNRLNRVNTATQYFEKIYGKYLFEDLPLAREYIHYDGNKVTGTDKMIDVLRNMRVKSKYYEYVDAKFYKEFKGELQSLEDSLVMINDNVSDRAYQEFYNKLDNNISRIYSMTSKKIFGIGKIERMKLKNRKNM